MPQSFFGCLLTNDCHTTNCLTSTHNKNLCEDAENQYEIAKSPLYFICANIATDRTMRCVHTYNSPNRAFRHLDNDIDFRGVPQKIADEILLVCLRLLLELVLNQLLFDFGLK